MKALWNDNPSSAGVALRCVLFTRDNVKPGVGALVPAARWEKQDPGDQETLWEIRRQCIVCSIKLYCVLDPLRWMEQARARHVRYDSSNEHGGQVGQIR